MFNTNQGQRLTGRNNYGTRRIDVVAYLQCSSANVSLLPVFIVVGDLAFSVHATYRDSDGSKIGLPNKALDINAHLCGVFW
jgi:hypothetical protein